MFVEKVKSGKNYHCYLLRKTFREDGKVKHRTIASDSAEELRNWAGVILPEILPAGRAKVASRRQLNKKHITS